MKAVKKLPKAALANIATVKSQLTSSMQLYNIDLIHCSDPIWLDQ